MTGQVPPRPDAWPPDVFQLAHVVSRMHWVLEQLAFDLSNGTADREQVDSVADALEGLARLLRLHELDGRNLAGQKDNGIEGGVR